MDRKRRSEEHNIPDELWEEIFVRLPIKTLGRLRCVSKPWNSLIPSSSFVAEYQKRNPKPSLIPSHVLLKGMELYVRKHPNDRVDLHYFPFSQKGRLSFLDAINGVVCLVSSCSSRSVILFNPTIRYYVEIPDSTLLHQVWDNTFLLGFGFEEGEGFKVVRFGNPLPRDKIVYEVYSTEKGVWRNGVGSETIRFTQVVSRNSFFMNGIVHWVVRSYNPVENMESLELLMFDCKGEDFTSVKLPQRIYHVNESWCKPMLFKCRENLSIISNDEVTRQLWLWVMEDYGVAGSWKEQKLQWSNQIDLVIEETLFLMDSPNAKPISERDIQAYLFCIKKKINILNVLSYSG